MTHILKRAAFIIHHSIWRSFLYIWFDEGPKHQTPTNEKQNDRWNNIVVPSISFVRETQFFFQAQHPCALKTKQHPQTKTGSHSVWSAVRSALTFTCKQPNNRSTNVGHKGEPSGQDSAVYLHLKVKGHSFKDVNVYILDWQDWWFERGLKAAIYVHCERPSLNRGGALVTYNAVLGSFPRYVISPSLFATGDLNSSYDGGEGPYFTDVSPFGLGDSNKSINQSKFIYIAHLKTKVLIKVLHKLGNKNKTNINDPCLFSDLEPCDDTHDQCDPQQPRGQSSLGVYYNLLYWTLPVNWWHCCQIIL